MPDITCCKGDGCPIKQSCFRYLAEPDKGRQSYFSKSPNKGKKCDYYWKYKERTTKESSKVGK